MELKRERNKEGRNDRSTVYRIWKKRYYRRKSIRTRKKRDLVSKMQNREKAMVELGSSSILHRGKSIAQQSSVQTEILKSTTKKENKQRDIRKTFKILREIQLNIGVEKVDTHKRVTVKALLNNGITGIFMDKKMVAKHKFRLQKLDRPVTVRNVNSTNNSTRAITYQVKVNMYFKNHVKK